MPDKPADKKPETAPVDPHISGTAGGHTLFTGDGKPVVADPHVQPVPPKPAPRAAAAAAPKPEPESPFAAMLRRVREANGERITTTKAQWARVCADETADPMQLLELQHLVDQLDIYITDR